MTFNFERYTDSDDGCITFLITPCIGLCYSKGEQKLFDLTFAWFRWALHIQIYI